MRNPYFTDVLGQMAEVHDRKNEDYAADDNPFSNFSGVAAMTGLETDKVFQVMIGIKMERLKQLVGTGKAPNNESVDDTILDLANYAAIWLAWRKREQAGSPIEARTMPASVESQVRDLMAEDPDERQDVLEHVFGEQLEDYADHLIDDWNDEEEPRCKSCGRTIDGQLARWNTCVDCIEENGKLDSGTSNKDEGVPGVPV